jgi:hypothetical protein
MYIPQLHPQYPTVSDNPRVYTYGATYRDPTHASTMSQSFMESYEDSDLLLLLSAGLQLFDQDWALLNSIKPPVVQDNFAKKAKLRNLLADVTMDNLPTHVLGRLGLTLADAQHMQRVITSATDQLRLIVKGMFPMYKIVGEDITWRFTATEAEEMHYDSYGTTPTPHHHVRLFVNLDDKPRLWAISQRVENTMRTYRDRLKEANGLDPNSFNGRVNKLIPWDEMPRKYVTFMPGNAWLVNSQIVAHEIIYGRKMVACTFNVDPASMLDQKKSFNNVVRQTMKEVYGEG